MFSAGQMPGILIVQHMPEMFTASFAKRLDGLCHVRVKEAEHGEKVLPGTAYLAPGHSHLSVRRVAGGYVRARPVRAGESASTRRGCAVQLGGDRQVGGNALGVILTGMGKDGAQGLLAMRRLVPGRSGRIRSHAWFMACRGRPQQLAPSMTWRR
jgi:two-component system chemotaxis response regulator CheB